MTSPIPVVHLSVVHRPDDTRIHERECRTLAEAGYDVTYLVPGATAGRDDHGVCLASLPVRSRTRRILSSREIVAALRALRPYVVHTHDPELLTLFPLLRPFVPRLVCDVHEHVAGAVLGKEYIPAGARRAVSAATGLALRGLVPWAHGVVVAYDDMLRQLGPWPRLRLVAPNYPRISYFDAAAPIADLAADPRLRLVYIGGLSQMRGCSLMLDVMERLDRDDALLILGGVFDVPDTERRTMARLAGGLGDRVRFLGRVPRAQLASYLASADVVWNPMLPSDQYALPNIETKIYEGAAVGLAVLTSDLPGRTELVESERLGIAVPPTVDGHLNGVHRLLADRAAVAAMGERGRAVTRERYSWEAVEGQFLDFYARLCHGRHRS